MIKEYHIKKRDIDYTDSSVSFDGLGVSFATIENMEFAIDCDGKYIGIYAINEEQVLGLYKFYLDDFIKNQDYYFRLYAKLRSYFIRSVSKCIMG